MRHIAMPGRVLLLRAIPVSGISNSGQPATGEHNSLREFTITTGPNINRLNSCGNLSGETTRRQMEAILETSSARILLVEDFEPYRSSVVSMLRECSNCSIISKATDGLEAVAQAQRLRPDIVLMDIGLPKMDGLEAARRIHVLVPSAKIIFLTADTDVELIEEAFRVGGWAYVLKQQAATDLLAAIAAVLQGRQFASSGLDDAVTPTRNLTD